MKAALICYLSVLCGLVCAQSENARIENFKNPPLIYRMHPNVHGYPLEEEKQIAVLENCLSAGYGGMTTNVNMTQDYLNNDRQLTSFYQFVRLARDRNMEVWLYDEKGYPSGMAGDYILSEHPDWEAEGFFFRDTLVMGGSHVKMKTFPGKIRIAKAIPANSSPLSFDKGQDLIQRIKDGVLEWDVPAGQWKIVLIATGALYEGFQASTDRGGSAPRYTSLLMPEVTTRFIDLTHRKYADFLGDKLSTLFFATFTDEPSTMSMPYFDLGYGVYPWKENVSEEFKKRTGSSLDEQLIPMMLDAGYQGQKARVQYFSIITDFMTGHYFKPIQDFCHQQGIKSSGHLLVEETMMAHVPLYGNIMACYRGMDIPGIDVLTGMPDYTRRYLLSGRLASSAAELEGNSMVMTEVCPVADHAVYAGKEAPTIHIKGTINRQLIAGIDKFNNYLQLQHEDNTGKQNFNNYIARICMMMSGGKRASRIAVYYPIESLWAKYRPQSYWLRDWDNVQGGDDAAQHLSRLFDEVSFSLFDNHWEFSYIDAQGIIENDLLNRDLLILPGVETLPLEAMEKIAAFCEKGGRVIAIEALPANSLTDFPSDKVKQFVAAIPQKNLYFEPSFNRDNMEQIINSMIKNELTISPKNNVLVSHKIIDNKNVYLITNDNSQNKDLIIESNGRPLMLWNPQTGEVTPMNRKRLNLGAYESMIITEQ